MGSLVSSRVAAGIAVLHTHINNLWTDLVYNHDHSSGKGGQVDHGELAETSEISGMNHTHSNIETHMNGSTGSFSDVGGGDQGVHGHASVVYVAGSMDSQMVIMGGEDTLDGSGDCTVTFPQSFSVLKAISVTMSGTPANPGHPLQDTAPYTTGESTSGFTAHANAECWANTTFYWMAIGTKA